MSVSVLERYRGRLAIRIRPRICTSFLVIASIVSGLYGLYDMSTGTRGGGGLLIVATTLVILFFVSIMMMLMEDKFWRFRPLLVLCVCLSFVGSFIAQLASNAPLGFSCGLFFFVSAILTVVNALPAQSR